MARSANEDGSGTDCGSRLMVAPATVPRPPEEVTTPFRVAVRLPVTSVVSGERPRKLNRAGLMDPAMKLAEKEDCATEPPVGRVKPAFWNVPVKRSTTPLPRLSASVIAPPGPKKIRLDKTVDAAAVVQLIAPSVMLVLGELALACTEVNPLVKEKTSGNPARLQLDPVEVLELKERLSALAGTARKAIAAARHRQPVTLLINGSSTEH
jgi:hypothetical protein